MVQLKDDFQPNKHPASTKTPLTQPLNDYLMNIFLVGGAIRDKLLSLPVADHDWVVVGATPNELLQNGFQQVGQDFPVFLHPENHEEYALARTERKKGHGYKGFELCASPDVTLEQDLARRDFTINAMAEDSLGQLIDPFGGRQDIKDKVIRHVSPAFSEDPLRVIRAARFAARFHDLGFTIADETLELMRHISKSGELSYLVAERVWQELKKVFEQPNVGIFFHTLQQCDALEPLFPELAFPELAKSAILPKLKALTELNPLAQQDTPHLNSIARAIQISLLLENTTAIAAFWSRLKAPNQINETCQIAYQIDQWLTQHTQVQDSNTSVTHTYAIQAESLLTLLQQTDAIRRSDRFLLSLTGLRASSQHLTAPQPLLELIPQALTACQNIKAKDLDISGLSGPDIQLKINERRRQAIAELLKT